MIVKLLEKIKPFASKEELMLGSAIFLMVSLAFGAGIVLGSKTYQRPPITVNCPLEFYQIP